MDGLRKRNNERFRIKNAVQIADDALMHDSRRIPARRDGGNRAIGPIGYVVKRRHIDAFDLRGAPQKRLLGRALALAGFVQVDQLEVDLLTLAQDKQIDEIGDRLGVAGARAARHNERSETRTVL